MESACVVVAWSCRCEATHIDASHLASNHEEADTKLLLHVVDATISGVTSIEIISPDTDVFVLSLRRFSQLCQNTTFITGRGEHLRKIALACKEIVSISFELRFSLTRKGEVAMLEGIPRY